LKTAIVTGGTGFLGFALIQELVKNGVQIYAVCRKHSSRLQRLEGISGVKIIETDLFNPNMSEMPTSADVFYHLAWEGARDDFDAQYKNIEMSINCVRIASQLSCKRFICTGSQAEYGNTSELITETTELNPTTAYGSCKVAAYYLASDLISKLGIEFVWARVFSVYGANDNPNTLISSLFKELMLNKEAFLQTDGEHIWNYLYDADATLALRLLGSVLNPDKIYNVASCSNKPLKAYTEILRNVVDTNSIIHYGNDRSLINLNVSTEKLVSSIGKYELNSYEECIGRIMCSKNM